MKIRPCILSLFCVLPLLIGTASAQEEETFWLFSDEPALGFLRDVEVADGWKFSAGGALRHRYMDEQNRLRPMGEVARNTYQLWRFYPWAQITNGDITGYVQVIDASSFGENLPILPIDENRSDLLQYYIDLNLADFDNDGSLHFRGGRQFLKYGKEHLISPLGWSNTFRNFEGFKLYYTSGVWDIDGFAVQPVNGAASARQFRPYSNDEMDRSQWFSGVYASYKGLPNGVIDFYWLWLKENDRLMNRLDGNRQTIGMRYAGSSPILTESMPDTLSMFWDFEGAYQYGKDDFQNGGSNLDVRAGFLSLIGGVTVTSSPWKPTIQGIFWWGSGDKDPTDGENNTVITLFPLGHAYWGLIDQFSGSNLQDYGIQISVQPHEKLKLATTWHYFRKDQKDDHIYNIAGAPLGNLVTTASHIGNELDFIGTLQLNKNLQVQLGYLYFWYGQAVSANAGIPQRGNAHMFYAMTTWNF